MRAESANVNVYGAGTCKTKKQTCLDMPCNCKIVSLWKVYESQVEGQDVLFETISWETGWVKILFIYYQWELPFETIKCSGSTDDKCSA